MLTTNPQFPLTTEYHIASSSSDPAPPLLVFIPGNPGLIDYYTTYLDLIHEQYPEYQILAISHAGFQTSDDFVAAGKVDPAFFGLEYQVDHKCAILKEHILAGRRRLSFLCHSVGGYVTQRVIRQLQHDPEVKHLVQIEFVGLLCPTIADIAISDSGVKFSKLFNWLPVVQIALFFVSFLQLVISETTAKNIIGKYILSRPVKSDARSTEAWNHAIDATCKIYRSKRIARQALELAREELRVIHRDDAFNDAFFRELPSQGTRIWCFFASDDYWVHDNTRDYILTRYHDEHNKNLRFEVGEASSEHSHAITHSFCIDQSVEFAAITCKALKP